MFRGIVVVPDQKTIFNFFVPLETMVPPFLSFVVAPGLGGRLSRRGMAFMEGEVQAELAELTVEGLTVVGSGVLAGGALLAFVNFGLTLGNAITQQPTFEMIIPFDRKVGSGPATVTRVRLQLAQLLALGLELLIISDLVETLVKSSAEYTFETLYKLAVIASIRTALSFCLGIETKDIIERAETDQRLDGIPIDQCRPDVDSV